MDPKETLWDIFLASQRVGQSSSKETILENLDEIIENATNLKEWIKKGGHRPDMFVWLTRIR